MKLNANVISFGLAPTSALKKGWKAGVYQPNINDRTQFCNEQRNTDLYYYLCRGGKPKQYDAKFWPDRIHLTHPYIESDAIPAVGYDWGSFESMICVGEHCTLF